MVNQRNLRVGIIAGEVSGDILGAGLISALRRLYPNAQFEGIAGPKMQAQGCHSLFDMEELSVMGLVEVLSRLRRLLLIRRTIVTHFIEDPPDVFIGIDAPDFNLGVESRLKAAGIKTIHYVSPTIWAWREKRIHKIAAATNLVLGLFPFEKAVYDKYQVPYTFVGHTLAEEVPIEPNQGASRELLNVEDGERILAVLPGSRSKEVEHLLAPFIQAAVLLSARLNGLRVLIPVVNRERKAQIEQYLAHHDVPLDIQIVIGHSREAMIAADAVLLASGTATLEAMLCKKPMVVAYKMSGLTHWMMKYLFTAKYFSLPNLLADKEVVPELLQDEVNPENLAVHLHHVMTAPKGDFISLFTQLHHKLKQDADATAAAAVQDVIET